MKNFTFRNCLRKSQVRKQSLSTLFSLFLLVLAFVLASPGVKSQVQISAGTTTTIDFSNTTPVTAGTTPASAYGGLGFAPNPTTAGYLNSNAWAVAGWSSGDIPFGGTSVSGSHTANGSTAVEVYNPGMYAYTGSPNSVTNPSLMIQPNNANNFEPGSLTLRMKNTGTSIINQIAVSYNLYVRNSENASSSLNFSYSTDNITYTSITTLDYTSPGNRTNNPPWTLVPGSPSRSTTISTISLAPGATFYIRWNGGVVNASGATRDELGLDDIKLTPQSVYPDINIKQGTTNYASGSTYAFANTISGNSSAATTFTIANVGSANLSVSSIVSSSADFVVSALPTLPATIAGPSGTTTFVVTFKPTTAGNKTGTITVTSNDPDEGTYTIDLTGTATVSTASDIIVKSGYVYNSNIAYNNYQAANITGGTTDIELARFTIRDGGGTVDADNLGTTLSQLVLNISNSANIRRIALYEGAVEVGTEQAGAPSVTFSGLNLATTDGGTKEFIVRVSFNSTVTDNQNIGLTIAATTTAAATGSGFATTNAGGATTSIAGTNNKIIVTATMLAFYQGPSNSIVNTTMSPAVIVTAVDALANVDLDFSGTITLSTTGTFSAGATKSIAAVGGSATFSNLVFSAPGSGLTLTGTATGVTTTGASNAFAVCASNPVISYTGTPFCLNGGIASVTMSGASGGTFSSTTGLVISPTTGDITLGTSAGGTYTVTYLVNASGACAQYTATTTVVVNGGGTWTGASNTNWNNPANWECSMIPTLSTNVLIPATAPLFPVITSSTGMCNNLTLEANTSIVITNGVLQIKGVATAGAGSTITATIGKVEFNGTTAQTVPAGLFKFNTIKDLVITNSAGVTLAGSLGVTNSVKFGNVNNSSLNSNGYLTLVSTSSNTASLLDITNGGINSGNTVNGNVTVERYAQGRRVYRFMTAPVNSSTNIRANWMEGVNNATPWENLNPFPNYGTHITGAGGSGSGFDASQTNNPSLFTFNSGTQGWVAVTSTNGQFVAGNAYRILLRGSRAADLNNNESASSVTTLRARGSLVTGTVTMAKAGGTATAGTPALSTTNNAYSLVGNPYASTVDWLQLDRTDVSSTFYIYDPTISGSNGRGQYVSYNGVNKVTSIANSAVSNDIQSGQAFFVVTSGPNPSLTFKENYKTTGSRQVFRTTGNDLPNLSLQLLLPTTTAATGPADGARVFFSDEFKTTVGDEDSYKLTNMDENIAVLKAGKYLSIEGRKPVYGSDTIPVRMWQLTQSNYTLQVAFDKFPSNVEAYLQDAYLHTTTPLNISGETLVPIAITSDAASKANDRFSILFESLATLPVRITGIKAYEKNKGVQIDWSAESENSIELYEVEKSADAQHFTTIGSSKAKNNPAVTASYSCTDVNPYSGDNYYRIKTIDNAGNSKLSEVLRVLMTDQINTISITNNPMNGTNLNLLFNNVEKGNYMVTLVNSAGEKVYAGSTAYPGGRASQQIVLPQQLPSGMYHLQVTNGSFVKALKLLVQ